MTKPLPVPLLAIEKRVSLNQPDLTVYFDDNKALDGLGRESARSGAVSMVTRGANAIFQFGAALFLARLLTPEDYGLVAMVLAITGFATLLVDLGSRDAIVQRPRISKGDVSTLFWITFATGSGLTLLVAASGPIIAAFYGEPRLTSITLVSSLTFATTALWCQHHALMRRALMFRRLALIEVVAGVSSAVLAIAMALGGWHYWALVIRPVAMSLFIACGVWLHCRWWPGRLNLTPAVRSMIGFGIPVIGNAITDFARSNVDRIAIGKCYGPNGLGQYQNGLQVYSNLLDPLGYLHEVAVGSLCKVLHHPAEFRRLWAKALSTMTFFAMPLFGVLAVTSQDLIVLVLGSRWSTAGTILSILALRGIPQVMERTVGWLHVPAGRTDRLMRWGLVAAFVQVVALFIGLPFGLVGVATAGVVCSYVLVLPALAYAGRPLGLGVKDSVEVTGRQFLGAVASAGVGFVLRDTVLSPSSSVERIRY